mgnify:CR=1 FL=1
MNTDLDALADTVRDAIDVMELTPDVVNNGFASLNFLVAIAKEAEQSLVATRNALIGTQRVRDDYKARAERAERERDEWKYQVAEGVEEIVARAEAAEERVAELEGAISHPGIRRDLLWMAEGRKKEDRKHVDELLAVASPDTKEEE